MRFYLNDIYNGKISDGKWQFQTGVWTKPFGSGYTRALKKEPTHVPDWIPGLRILNSS